MTAPTQLPFPPSAPLSPADELRRLRALGPLHRVRTSVGDDAWLVTGYFDVRRLMDSDVLGRSHPHPDKAARSRASAMFGGPIGDFDSEPSDHARMRAVLHPLFSPRYLRTLQAEVDRACAGLLDQFENCGPPADFYSGLALPLPIMVICQLLGVPYSDRARFQDWVEASGSPTDLERSESGLAALFDYGMDLVAHKRIRPADDVVSRLCEHEDLTDLDVAMLSMRLLFAGYETTVVQLWLSAVLLVGEPERWQHLRRRPELLPRMLEECLRAGTPGGFGIPRYARVDFDVAGETIRAGDLVLLDVGSANHDPAAFADPDRFDATRTGAVHVSFGYGSHYCVGATLARMELTTVFTQLATRFPSVRLAVDPSSMIVRLESMGDGLNALPLAW